MIEIAVAVAFLVLLLLGLGAVLLFAKDLLLPSQTVTISINGERSIAADSNQRLLGILTGAGIAMPSACAGAGTCGLCRVAAVTGGGDPLPTELARLSRSDIRDGVRLACQVTVRGDMSLTVPEDVLGVRTLTCRVASTTSLTPLVREIVLDLPEESGFHFRAGNFVQVTVPPYRLDYADITIPSAHEAQWETLGLRRLSAASDIPVSRAYSLANRSADVGRLVLNIRLATPPPAVANAPPGIVSSWLFGLAAGDKMEVAGPYGSFAASDTTAEMVLIGGGVGMAPLRAIIHDQLERLKSDRPISFWYGARSRAELFYVDEFEELARRHRNFCFVPVLSEPSDADNWTGATGFVHDVCYQDYLKDHPAPETAEYYLCGPPLMIQAVFRMLDECGVDERSIFFDDFGS